MKTSIVPKDSQEEQGWLSCTLIELINLSTLSTGRLDIYVSLFNDAEFT